MQKKLMKNHILKPPTFTLIMLSSIQPVRIPKKITVFLIILVKTSKFSDGRAKMAKNGGLRRYAANDKIFKLFFLHPFLASTIYNNTIKNKFDIG